VCASVLPCPEFVIAADIDTIADHFYAHNGNHIEHII
jgi:hypothetical protein